MSESAWRGHRVANISSVSTSLVGDAKEAQTRLEFMV